MENNTLNKKINQLSLDCQTTQFWKMRINPPLVDVFLDSNDTNELITVYSALNPSYSP